MDFNQLTNWFKNLSQNQQILVGVTVLISAYWIYQQLGDNRKKAKNQTKEVSLQGGLPNKELIADVVTSWIARRQAEGQLNSDEGLGMSGPMIYELINQDPYGQKFRQLLSEL